MKTQQKMLSIATKFMLLPAMALSGSLLAQPIVQVPASCNVVVAGTGGTVGFGGQVGSGGIVIMPDLASAAGNFNVIPLGNTILGWSLRGDLSVGPISQPAPANQSLPSGTMSAFITSYNKQVRTSEQTGFSADYLARSKGRITIGYNNISTTCGGSISFDIFKRYANSGWPTTGTQDGYIPPIIGPDCIEPNKIYTYSVDQVATDNYSDGIGGDSYYWSITPSLGTFYTSADNSSITFTTPSSLSGPYTIQCCFGRANPWDADLAPPSATTCVTKQLGLQPGPPSFITAPPTCVLTSASSFNIVAPAGPSYTWTSSNPLWTLTPTAGGSNLTVSTLGADPGILTLTVVNGGCVPSVFTYTINRQLASPIVITSSSPSPTCVVPGTITNYQLSAGLGNTTCWTLPTGWTFTNANGAASSINLTVPTGTAPGSYVIQARSCACPAGVLNFTVNVRPGIPVISGPACVVRNGGPAVVYTATGATGASSYTWTIPSGWICLSGCSTNSVTLLPGGTATTTQTISVVANGTGGCNATSAAFNVNYSPIAPNTITASCWNFGVAGTTNITVANAPSPFYGSYTITSTPSGLITSSTVVGGVIQVTTSASAPAGSYTLNITHTTTACGNSTTTSFPITYNGNGSVLTTFFNPGPGGPDVYIVSSAPGGATYHWFVNGPPVSGATSSVFSLTGSGTPPTSVCVEVSSGGCMTRLCANPPGTHSFAPSDPSGQIDRLFAQVAVFPNPNDGNFTLKIPAFEQEASVVILDATGKEVGTHVLKEGENRISERGLITGEYFLVLNIDGHHNSYKVQVSQK
jgi:hypothetical protein